jgi:hypothetical protein
MCALPAVCSVPTCKTVTAGARHSGWTESAPEPPVRVEVVVRRWLYGHGSLGTAVRRQQKATERKFSSQNLTVACSVLRTAGQVMLAAKSVNEVLYHAARGEVNSGNLVRNTHVLSRFLPKYH